MIAFSEPTVAWHAVLVVHGDQDHVIPEDFAAVDLISGGRAASATTCPAPVDSGRR